MIYVFSLILKLWGGVGGRWGLPCYRRMLIRYLKVENYEGKSVSNQPVPFPMDRDGHSFHALFQYMFYKSVQN